MFDRPFNIEHNQKPKRYFNSFITAHNILKGFLVFSYADIYLKKKNRSSKALNFVQNDNFSI